jgi:hypothetical protein
MLMEAVVAWLEVIACHLHGTALYSEGRGFKSEPGVRRISYVSQGRYTDSNFD